MEKEGQGNMRVRFLNVTLNALIARLFEYYLVYTAIYYIITQSRAANSHHRQSFTTAHFTTVLHIITRLSYIPAAQLV